MFAHDTTSFCNNKNDTRENNVWGYKFNSIIRDTVGLDRYGILSNEYLKKGNTLKSTDEDFDKAVQTAKRIILILHMSQNLIIQLLSDRIRDLLMQI